MRRWLGRAARLCRPRALTPEACRSAAPASLRPRCRLHRAITGRPAAAPIWPLARTPAARASRHGRPGALGRRGWRGGLPRPRAGAIGAAGARMQADDGPRRCGRALAGGLRRGGRAAAAAAARADRAGQLRTPKRSALSSAAGAHPCAVPLTPACRPWRARGGGGRAVRAAGSRARGLCRHCSAAAGATTGAGGVSAVRATARRRARGACRRSAAGPWRLGGRCAKALAGSALWLRRSARGIAGCAARRAGGPAAGQPPRVLGVGLHPALLPGRSHCGPEVERSRHFARRAARHHLCHARRLQARMQAYTRPNSDRRRAAAPAPGRQLGQSQEVRLGKGGGWGAAGNAPAETRRGAPSWRRWCAWQRCAAAGTCRPARGSGRRARRAVPCAPRAARHCTAAAPPAS